jgi:hypothetical protein
MGQVRLGSATTTHAVRAAIQRSQASLAKLSKELGINPKTVAKWRKCIAVEDLKTGPKEPRSTVLSEEEEAAVVTFRRHGLLPLDDCLYALEPLIPHLTRSALHRCLQRHSISRLPDVEGEKPKRKKFKHHPIGFFHIDIAEVQTAEGKLYLFVGIDRTAKFAVAQLVATADRSSAWEFPQHMLEAVPYQVPTILTDNVLAREQNAVLGVRSRGIRAPRYLWNSCPGGLRRQEVVSSIANTGSDWLPPSPSLRRGPKSQAEGPNIIYEVASCASTAL